MRCLYVLLGAGLAITLGWDAFLNKKRRKLPIVFKKEVKEPSPYESFEITDKCKIC